MPYFYLLFFITILQIFCYYSYQDAVDFNPDLHCRDNDNFPVDWWIIYKPPGDTSRYFDSGLNFTYITSFSDGRWEASVKQINANSMLQYTLAPVYKKKLKQYIAVMSYGIRNNEGNNSAKSTAYGIMFSNHLSGVWISHTVPGFPNLAKKPAVFPSNELNNGHMIVCQSVYPVTLNAIALVVRHTDSSILKFTVPDSMMVALPEWTSLDSTVSSDTIKSNQGEIDRSVLKTHRMASDYTESGTYRPFYVRGSKTKVFNFETRAKSSRGMVLARSPGDTRCLFNTFAKIHGIVIDVYNALYKQRAVCKEEYSLRIINSISLKYPEQEVHYIDNSTDKTNFGISTAAPWQRMGQSATQYWTCIGNFAQESLSSTKGGLLLCINHYYVWLAFDNLKVKEPECQ